MTEAERILFVGGPKHGQVLTIDAGRDQWLIPIRQGTAPYYRRRFAVNRRLMHVMVRSQAFEDTNTVLDALALAAGVEWREA